jgi:hypothetical protein
MRGEIDAGRKKNAANKGAKARGKFGVGKLLFYGSEAGFGQD